MDRRELFKATVLFPICCCGFAGSAPARPTNSNSCLSLSIDAGRPTAGAYNRQGRPDRLFPKSGDRLFDLALAITLDQMVDMFGVYPIFTFFDDGGQPNALAARPIPGSNERDGVVYVGSSILSNYLGRREHADVAIAAIVAHEFSHIKVFKHGVEPRVLRGQPTVKRAELLADFLAGYYGGRKKLERASYPAVIYAKTLHELGDFVFTDRNHHGTPQERADAVGNGYHVAYRQRRSMADALQAGVEYVMKIA